jgi:hypothetical protein
MKAKYTTALRAGLLGLLLVFGLVPNALGSEISIEVAPNVLNLQSEGYIVTVHTDIAYGRVDVHSVHLNGVLIHSWKADNRGFFVAKFLMDEIQALEGLVIDGQNELLLIGATIDDPPESFSGTDWVWVVDNLPVKGGK